VSAEPNFEGWPDRWCGEHRTVGSHRAWCFDCSEWCYSGDIEMACPRCLLPRLFAQRNDLLQALEEIASWPVRVPGVREAALAAIAKHRSLA
jgi:hypothetical protein